MPVRSGLRKSTPKSWLMIRDRRLLPDWKQRIGRVKGVCCPRESDVARGRSSVSAQSPQIDLALSWTIGLDLPYSAGSPSGFGRHKYSGLNARRLSGIHPDSNRWRASVPGTPAPNSLKCFSRHGRGVSRKLCERRRDPFFRRGTAIAEQFWLRRVAGSHAAAAGGFMQAPAARPRRGKGVDRLWQASHLTTPLSASAR